MGPLISSGGGISSSGMAKLSGTDQVFALCCCCWWWWYLVFDLFLKIGNIAPKISAIANKSLPIKLKRPSSSMCTASSPVGISGGLIDGLIGFWYGDMLSFVGVWCSYTKSLHLQLTKDNQILWVQ